MTALRKVAATYNGEEAGAGGDIIHAVLELDRKRRAGTIPEEDSVPFHKSDRSWRTAMVNMDLPNDRSLQLLAYRWVRSMAARMKRAGVLAKHLRRGTTFFKEWNRNRGSPRHSQFVFHDIARLVWSDEYWRAMADEAWPGRSGQLASRIAAIREKAKSLFPLLPQLPTTFFSPVTGAGRRG